MLDRIVADPNVHFGKPCVQGTRIPVHAVLELIEDGVPLDEIPARYYPDLSLDDVKACVAYAAALARGDETHESETSP